MEMKMKMQRVSDLKRCHYCFKVVNSQSSIGYFVQAMRRYDAKYRNSNRLFCSSKCIAAFYNKPLKYAQLYVSYLNRLVDIRFSGRKFSGRGFVTRHNSYVTARRRDD